MGDFLFQNSGFVLQAICLFLAVGFSTLYSLRYHARRNRLATPQRRRSVRVVGGLFLLLGILLLAIMLIIGFEKKGAAFAEWAFVFVLATGVESVVLSAVVTFVALRQVKRVLGP